MEYFGLDARKRYTVFTHLDERGQLLARGRVGNDAVERLRSEEIRALGSST